MATPVAATQNAVGVLYETRTRPFYNRTGAPTTVGQVLMMDLTRSSTEAAAEYTSTADGRAGMNHLVVPTAAGILHYPLVVCNEIAADDALVTCTLYGVCTATMAAATALGADLIGATSADLTAGGANTRTVAICLVATGAAGNTLVMFDGNGLGIGV
jgi:hypothetical protein